LKEVGEAVSELVCEFPVPLRATIAGEVFALFVRDKLPVKLPADAGANLTENEAEPLGAMVSGKVIPDKVNPVPEIVAWVMLRSAVPGFRTVTLCDCELPTRTLPKLRLEGVALMSGWTPVPLRKSVDGEFEALLTMLMAPVAGPLVVGEKAAVSETVCPAERLALPLSPLTLKPAPLTATCERLMVVVPELVMVKGKEPDVPTRTLPNARLPGEVVVEDEAGTPAPETEMIAETWRCRVPVTTMLPLNWATTSGRK
jgi:hypothetical protein